MQSGRFYDIWMPLAMLLLAVIAAVSVATFVMDNAFHDGKSMCTVIQGPGQPPTQEPCWLVNSDTEGNDQ